MLMIVRLVYLLMIRRGGGRIHICLFPQPQHRRLVAAAESGGRNEAGTLALWGAPPGQLIGEIIPPLT
jgi:hypothetical protein